MVQQDIVIDQLNLIIQNGKSFNYGIINGLFRTEEIENNSKCVPQQFKIKRFDRKYIGIIDIVLLLQDSTYKMKQI